MAASELLKAHGYDKNTKHCEEQWKYMVSSFRRGGYRQFTDQMNLIYLLAPSLLTLQPNTENPNMLTIRSEQQTLCENQTPEISSPPETEDIAKAKSSKKIKMENQGNVSGTLNNEIESDLKTSVSENVMSYVQINVSKSSSKETRDKISTDEPKDEEGLATLSQKENSEISQNKKNEPKILKHTENKRQKHTRGRGKVKRSSSPDDNLEFTRVRVKRKRDSPPASVKSIKAKTSMKKSDDRLSLVESPKTKLQVEVLSITKNEHAKLLECQTMPGTTPTRTFKLHYPADHPLPPGLKHLYIPLDMIQSPENVPSSKSSVTDVQSRLHSIPSSSKVLSVSDMEHKLSGKISEQSETKEKLSALVTDANIDLEREGLMKLLHQYSQECQQEKLRLFNLIKENNQEHISALKKIASGFRDLMKSV